MNTANIIAALLVAASLSACNGSNPVAPSAVSNEIGATTNAAPSLDAPEIHEPVNGSQVDSLTPQLAIGNSPRTGTVGAVVYKFEISESQSFGGAVEFSAPEGGGETRVQVQPALKNSATYFWRVSARASNASSPYTPVQQFTTPGPQYSGPGHIPPGPTDAGRAEKVTRGTAAEFPELVKAKRTVDESIASAEELLRRIVWHLQLAGFKATRQRNPSGLISNDKFAVEIDGVWRYVDFINGLGTANADLAIQFALDRNSLGNPIRDGSGNIDQNTGIPD